MAACPTDGTTLVSVDIPGSPPNLCTSCARAFWPSELTPRARALWNPLTRSFRTGPEGDAIRASARADHRASDKARSPGGKVF